MLGGLSTVADHVSDWVSTAWVAVVTGRLCWHIRLVQKGERGIVSKELLLEIPVVLFTYIVSAGICDHMHWTGRWAGAMSCIIAYFGPAGLVAAAQLYAKASGKPD